MSQADRPRNGPAVSVIVPAYNAERFIGATLDSVFAQTFQDFEVIVVDDGSTDGTGEVVGRFPSVRYYAQENRGPAAARNAGLARARGEYVSLLDSDDVWHPDMLQACVEVLEGRPDVGAVHTNWLSIKSDGEVFAHSGWQPWRGNVFQRLLVDIPFMNGSIVWRRECFERCGGFDETPGMNDDWLAWLRIAWHYTFEYVEQPLAFYRRHDRNLTLQVDRVLGWRLRALDQICSEFEIPASVRAQAYAKIFFLATINALRAGDRRKAVDEFDKAVRRKPAILEERATYFDVAYANRPLGVAVSDFAWDLNQGTENVQGLLDGLYAQPGLPEVVVDRKRQARAIALFALAQMAYDTASEHAGQARRLLLHGLRLYPGLLLRPGVLVWSGLILAGQRLVRGPGRRCIDLLSGSNRSPS